MKIIHDPSSWRTEAARYYVVGETGDRLGVFPARDLAERFVETFAPDRSDARAFAEKTAADAERAARIESAARSLLGVGSPVPFAFVCALRDAVGPDAPPARKRTTSLTDPELLRNICEAEEKGDYVRLSNLCQRARENVDTDPPIRSATPVQDDTRLLLTRAGDGLAILNLCHRDALSPDERAALLTLSRVSPVQR